MGFATERRSRTDGYDHRPLPNTLRQRVLGGATAVSVAALCAWTICSTLADTGQRQIEPSGTGGDTLSLAGTRGDKLAVLKPSKTPASNVYASLFDPRSSFDFFPGNFANNASFQHGGNPLTSTPLLLPTPAVAQKAPNVLPMPSPNERVVQRVILPAPRPASAPSRNAPLADSTQRSQITSDTPSAKGSIFATIFEKLFGKPTQVKLAYATSDDGGLGDDQTAAGHYDQWTAVYDISAHTVYMPDGTQLEAHSGFGSLLDDPSHADEKMRGVTPPNVYDLQLREEPFHGVRALRLIPQDAQQVFGRAGLLAHSFMLGPNGDSNGCVSFKNYDAFLQAYLDHKVKRLAVVTSL
jgi:Protein of unknown function (DUF2778)